MIVACECADATIHGKRLDLAIEFPMTHAHTTICLNADTLHASSISGQQLDSKPVRHQNFPVTNDLLGSECTVAGNQELSSHEVRFYNANNISAIGMLREVIHIPRPLSTDVRQTHICKPTQQHASFHVRSQLKDLVCSGSWEGEDSSTHECKCSCNCHIHNRIRVQFEFALGI